MYAQVEKPKENKSRSVANSVTQKKSNVKQGFGIGDNRPEAKAQSLLQLQIKKKWGQKATQLKVVQRAEGDKIKISNDKIVITNDADEEIGYLDFEKSGFIETQDGGKYKGSLLSMINVHNKYQGKGYATQLINKFFEITDAPYILSVMIDGTTPEAVLIEIYQKKGFVLQHGVLEKEGGMKIMVKGHVEYSEGNGSFYDYMNDLDGLSVFKNDEMQESPKIKTKKTQPFRKTAMGLGTTISGLKYPIY